MNLPVDDAVLMVAMFAAKRKDRTVVVQCDDFEVIGFENLAPVVVPLEPAWLLMVDMLDVVAAIMRHKHVLGDL
jgi:hypothetical protein